jgi:hypothetical protein
VSRAGQPDWLVIARREFLERVRTPWFVIVTLLGPVLMLGTILVPALLGRAVDNSARIAVVDRSPGQRVAPGPGGAARWRQVAGRDRQPRHSRGRAARGGSAPTPSMAS